MADNSKQQKINYSLPAGTTSFSFTYTLNERPTEVRLAQITRNDGSSFSSAYSYTWTYGNGSVSVQFQGLASAAHNVTIIAQV